MTDYQVGEKTYTLEELQDLIGDGEKKREYEKTYNTNFENAWSAYGKTQNENKRLSEEIEQLKKASETTQVNSAEPNLDEVFNKKGFVSKDDVIRLVDERTEYQNKVQTIAGQFSKLESEIDGKDGRPKFEKEQVLEYMQQNSLLDPEKAYNMMHLEEIANWRAEQIARKPGFSRSNTSNTATDKTPAPVTYNRDNIDAALKEALREGGEKF